MTVEYVSFTKEENGHVTKKRVIQKTKIASQSILNAAIDFKTLSSPTAADFPQAEFDGTEELKGDVPSRAVSVSSFFLCHVTLSHFADQTV